MTKESIASKTTVIIVVVIASLITGFFIHNICLPLHTFLDQNYRMILFIQLAIIAGIIGGVAKNSNEEKDILHTKNIILGIFSAFLTPIFLKLISSTYFSKFLNDQSDVENSFVFFALLLVFSYFAESFIYTVRDKIGALSEQTEKAKNEAKAAMKATIKNHEEIRTINEQRIRMQLARLQGNEISILKDIMRSFGEKETDLDDIYNLFNELEGSVKLPAVRHIIDSGLLTETQTQKYKLSNVDVLEPILEEYELD